MQRKPIKMQTIIDGDAVHYTVVVGDSVVWQQTVVLGQKERYRAGGQAFVEAARKQEEVANVWIDEP